MKCNCGSELTEENLTSEIAEHNSEVIDVQLICPVCDAFFNTFINFEDMPLMNA